ARIIGTVINMQRDSEHNDNSYGAGNQTADQDYIDLDSEPAPSASGSAGSSITKARLDASKLRKDSYKKKPHTTDKAPPAHRGSWAGWLILLACLCLALAPLLINLNLASPTKAETRTIATSTDSWQHQKKFSSQGVSFKRFTPTRNNQMEFDHSPGITWIHMLFFAGLGDGGSPGIDKSTAVYDGRIVSVIF